MPTLETIRRLSIVAKTTGTQQMEADLRKVSDAQNAVAKSSENAATVTETSSRRQLSAARAYERIVNDMQGYARAQDQFARQLRTISQAQQVGADQEQVRQVLAFSQSVYQDAGIRSAQRMGVDQTNVNNLLGITGGGSGSARDAASVFSAELDRLEEIARQKALQIGQQFQEGFNASLGIGGSSGSARDSAAVFAAELDRLDAIAQQKAAQIGQTFSRDLNASFGIGDSGKSARDSASVFEAAAKAEADLQMQAKALRAELDPLGAAQEVMNEKLVQYRGLAASNVISAEELAQAEVLMAEKTKLASASVGGLVLNRAGLMELQAAGVNTFQALAAGMSPLQVAMMEGSQVIGAFVQGTEGFFSKAKSVLGSGLTALSGTGFAGPILVGVTALTAAFVTLRERIDTGSHSIDQDLKDHKKWVDEITAAYNGASSAADKYTRSAVAVAQFHSADALLDLEKNLRSQADTIQTALGNFQQYASFDLPGLSDSDAQKIADKHFGPFADAVRDLQAAMKAGNPDFATFAATIAKDAESLTNPDLRKQADELIDTVQKAADAQRALGQPSDAISKLINDLDPARAKLANLRLEFAKLQDAIDAPGAHLDAATKKVTDELLASLQGQIANAQTDVANGSAEASDALRKANEAYSTVGLSDYAKGLRAINDELDVQLRKLGDAGQAAETYRTKIYPEQVKTYNDTYLRQSSNYGFSVAQSPQQYQQTILHSGAQSGVDPNLIATVLQIESHFRPDILSGATRSSAGAIGAGQFMPGTARSLGIDPTDVTQSIMGVGTYLKQLLDEFHGNVNAALAAYNGGTRQGELVAAGYAPTKKDTRDYLVAANARQDAMAATEALRQNDAAIKAQAESVAVLTGAYGTSFEAQERATLIEQKRAEEIARVGSVSDEAAKSISKTAAALASLDQQARAAQFGNDIQFSREQLGRAQPEQQVYSDLRSQRIDIDTPLGQAAAAADRTNIALTGLKETMSSGFSTFTSDIENGTSAMKALGDMSVDVFNKIIGKLEDSAISALFSTSSGSAGGGFLGSIAKWLGFAGGGYTGDGSTYQPAGIVHAGEYVMTAAATRRLGLPMLDTLNYGYADGGFVTPAVATVPAGFSAPAAMQGGGDTYQVNAGSTIVIKGNADDKTAGQLKQMLDERDRKFVADLPKHMIKAKRDNKLAGAFK